jgi:hypothetical protein
MKTDTPETDKFFATFADGEATPSHAEYYARLQDLERERDEARDENGTWKQIASGRLSKIAEVTAQRDRLAEALEKVSRSWNYVEVAQKALQFDPPAGRITIRSGFPPPTW